MKQLKAILRFIQTVLSLLLYPKGRHGGGSRQSVPDRNHTGSPSNGQQPSGPGCHRSHHGNGSEEKTSAVNVLGWMLISAVGLGQLIAIG